MDVNEVSTDTLTKLSLKPKFMQCESWEDLRDLMVLYQMDIVVNVKSTNTTWLEHIDSLERRGLVSIED
jgi:hypothetical protein